jgi:hypothetical protein
MTEFKVKPIRYKEFECIGDGFTFANHHRADPKTITEALQGTPHALERVRGKRRKSWWGAQVRLYGLKGKDWSIEASKAVLREALARGPLRVPEERMNKEYFVKREQLIEEEKRRIIEKDANFRVASTDDEKAEIDVRQFLQEKFESEDITFVVLRNRKYFDNVEATVRELNLFNACTFGDRRSGHRIVVVATTKNIAIRERDRIDREMQEETIAMEQRKWNTLNKKRLEFISVDGNGKSLAGHWVLHMPELYAHNYWEHSDGDCIIELPSLNPSEEYAYAKFKFVEFKGYFKIHVGKDTEMWQGVELKVDWEGSVDPDDGEEYDMETRHVALITFTSASECRGTIDGWFGGPWEFKGVKVSHETEVTAENCQGEYEREKKWWDENRAHYFDTSDPEKWYREECEECEVEEESMDEVKVEPAEAEGTLPAVKQEEEC